MKNLFIGFLTLMSATNVMAQNDKPIHAFSLEECVNYAQKNNVQVKNALLAVDVQVQTNREIAAAAYPSIGTNIGGTDFLKIPTSLLPGQIFGGAAGTFIPVQFGIMYKNGFAEKLDVDKVSVQLNNLQTEKIKANNSVAIGFMGLKMLMGMPVKDSLALTEVINEQSLNTDVLVENDFQYGIRKDYQYLSTVKKLSEYNVKRYQLSYLPTVNFSGAYSKNALRTKFDFFEGGDWFPTSLLSLNVNLPLFNGFAREARVKRTKIELKQIENQMDALKNNIDNENTQAKLNYISSVATVQFQKKNMQLAENVFQQTKKKFEAGTGSNTEISAAQADLVSAQNNFMNALYSALIAKVDLLKASGKL